MIFILILTETSKMTQKHDFLKKEGKYLHFQDFYDFGLKGCLHPLRCTHLSWDFTKCLKRFSEIFGHLTLGKEFCDWERVFPEIVPKKFYMKWLEFGSEWLY
jgi:hypothetical protein